MLGKAGSWLDDRVTNNWVKDQYEWDKEIVVVTGGSDGIGKEVVLLLAERGVRVAVMDVQPLTFEGTFVWVFCLGLGLGESLGGFQILERVSWSRPFDGLMALKPSSLHETTTFGVQIHMKMNI